MAKYEPESLHKLADTLEELAVLEIVFMAGAGLLVGFSTGWVAGRGDIGAAVVSALIVGAIWGGFGYFIALAARFGARMLVVSVEIERNTRALATVAAPQEYEVVATAADLAERPKEALQEQIAAISESMKAAGEPYSASSLYALGRMWALLFDETHDRSHRDKALAAMRSAQEADPSFFGFFTSEERERFGSLERDPDFASFSD